MNISLTTTFLTKKYSNKNVHYTYICAYIYLCFFYYDNFFTDIWFFWNFIFIRSFKYILTFFTFLYIVLFFNNQCLILHRFDSRNVVLAIKLESKELRRAFVTFVYDPEYIPNSLAEIIHSVFYLWK